MGPAETETLQIPEIQSEPTLKQLRLYNLKFNNRRQKTRRRRLTMAMTMTTTNPQKLLPTSTTLDCVINQPLHELHKLQCKTENPMEIKNTFRMSAIVTRYIRL